MFTTINDLKINYDDIGSGEFVLILHGWGSNIELHRHMATVLSQKYRVLMPDMPGFGQSELPSEPLNVDDYVNFIIEFLKPFEPKKLTLIGHSFGGRVIIKLCSLDLPFEIEKVILIDSAGVMPKKSAKQKLLQKGIKAGKKLLSSAEEKGMMAGAAESFRKMFGSDDYNAAAPVMRATLVNVVNEDLCDLMPNVKCPTLLIWGRNDDATPLSDGQKMEELMPESALIVFDGCGHYSFLENQGQFTAILCSFMNIG